MSILWNPAEATVVEKVSLPVITTGTQNMGDGIYWLKAGTPLDEDLAVANDGDAKYIVAEDFFFVSTNPNQDRHVPLVKAGYVDINKAEAAAGITFADAAKSALETAGIVLVDGLLDAGGGGGGGFLMINVTAGEQYTADVSYEDAKAAIEAGKLVAVNLSNIIYSLEDFDSSSITFGYVTLDQGTGEICHMQLFYTSTGFTIGSPYLYAPLFQFPSDPSEDGTYMLTCTVSDDGTNYYYDWTSVGT